MNRAIALWGAFLLLIIWNVSPLATDGTNVTPWDVESYGDETGFAQRVATTVPALAAQDYGKRSLAPSKCPDTGLPVRTWAVQGEEIISPYTGRRYVQGDTGYFGPKERDIQGRIARFGGDPMKFDLPPAAARLLQNPDDTAVRAFLSIPGNMRQQYHFACVNWVRFHALAGNRMGGDWKRDFAAAVAVYREGRKPSDGEREKQVPAGFAHDLVGEENEFFGGNVADGGTENHKTMWRTSGLLYAQWFGPDGRVSNYPASEAERITSKVLTRGWQDIMKVGNGEWDSSSYYPWQMRGFLNLYDFSPKAETRAIAKLALDYFFATYGLKMINGHFIGAQKRGFVPGFGTGAMDEMVRAYVPGTTQPGKVAPVLTLHQATTHYRPNRVISNIIAKNIPLPFEAQMARPTYHLKERNAFQETFYCDDGYALGSVAMTMEDNPTQQTVWSLGCRHAAGTFVFGGGQPKFRSPEGHSRYTQVVQKRGALVLMTAGRDLAVLPDRLDDAARWEQAPTAAESWLFVPHGAKVVAEDQKRIVIDAGETWVVVHPVGTGTLWMNAAEETAAPDPAKPDRGTVRATLRDYDILVARGASSGFVVEASLKKAWTNLAAVLLAVDERAGATVSTNGGFRVRYASLAGDTLDVRHNPEGMRASATINGTEVDWSRWAGNGVYECPYVTVRDGVMRVSDTKEQYEVDFTGPQPVWRSTAK